MINWHRLFGLVLTDFFTDTGYTVEVEKDLSLQQQFVDVIVVEQGEGAHLDEIPDGLENLAKHNLITYKSLREPLDGWTLDELIGHYVNYRKQVSPSSDQFLPVEDFRVYAVCTRKPQKLHQQHTLQKLQQGVYWIEWGTQTVRVIVLSEMPPTPNNAVWDLFSGVPRTVQYGAAQYHWRRANRSTATNDLFAQYAQEGMIMPYTFEDYFREKAEEYFVTHKQEFVQLLSPEERLKGLSPKDRLQGLSPEELEAYLKKLREQYENN